MTHPTGPVQAASAAQFVTLKLAEQLYGVPVASVRDILREQRINRIPLSPPGVAGSINLRGRIVTAIDLRRRLGLKPASTPVSMSVVFERTGELYALLVDQVCEVLTPDAGDFEAMPRTLAAGRARYCSGLFKMEASPMLVLDLEAVLTLDWDT